MIRKKKKILLGVPAFDGIVTEAQESFLNMVYYTAKNMPDYDLAIHIGYKREQFRARNNIVEAGISNDVDYILMLDDDMLVPANLIKRLIGHDVDVVGATYYQRGGAYHPVIMMRDEPDEPGAYSAHFIHHTHPWLTTDRGMHQADVIGGGCMMFKAEVFKKIIPPYFESERRLGTDLAICGRLKDEGVEIWVDTTVELGHVGEKQVITSRTIPMAEQALAKASDDLYKDVREYLSMHDEELLSAMEIACTKKARQDAWGKRNNKDDEAVQGYYREHPQWHILNLCQYAISKTDQFKEWALTVGRALIPKGGYVLDYGAGLGHTCIPLAQRSAFNVFSMDIAGSATEEFVKWRKAKHGLENLHIISQAAPYPEGSLFKKLDGAVMISVMDHLTHPYETVEWIASQLKSGAFFLCEYHLGSDDSEPQHLDRYELATFRQFLVGLGLSVSPEHNWLFFKD